LADNGFDPVESFCSRSDGSIKCVCIGAATRSEIWLTPNTTGFAFPTDIISSTAHAYKHDEHSNLDYGLTGWTSPGNSIRVFSTLDLLIGFGSFNSSPKEHPNDPNLHFVWVKQ
jgi:hypothetical protein